MSKEFKMVAESLNEYQVNKDNNEYDELNEGLVSKFEKLDKDKPEEVKKFAMKVIPKKVVGEANAKTVRKKIDNINDENVKQFVDVLEKAAKDKFKGRFMPYKGKVAYKEESKLNIKSQAAAGPTGKQGTSGM